MPQIATIDGQAQIRISARPEVLAATSIASRVLDLPAARSAFGAGRQK